MTFRTTTPQVPASPIFSLQIDPPPDSATLEKNPITMIFDVVKQCIVVELQSVSSVTTQASPPPSNDSLGESSIQNQQNQGVQNQKNYELDDVTCNFYDYSLVTNNL